MEARWLEPHEAALLLEAARLYRPDRILNPITCPHALIGTLLLTGGRTAEVLGLRVDDVSFDRKTVTFRPNEYRGLKTRTSHRAVPLWPQLEEILRGHVFGRDEPLGDLLFPSPRSGHDVMIRDLRKMLDRIGKLAGFEAGSIRTKIFRHTYCAARLQTLDRGVPVAPFTVARELGHSSATMIEKVYSHLGQVRHRAEVVEYRVEAFREELGERLVALGATATSLRTTGD
jgi:integrase